MALSPEQIQELRAKAGIPPEGIKSSNTAQDRIAKLRAGSEAMKTEETGIDPLDNKVTRGIKSIFPGEKVGEAIGTLGGYGIAKAKDALTGSKTAEQYDLSAPSPLQVAGDVAEGAAMVAGFKGAGTTGGFLKKAMQSAGVGAVTGGGHSLAEGNDLKEVAKDTATGAAIGAGTSAAFSGGEALLKSFRALPQRLIQSATGQSKPDILAGKDISKYMIENKRIGTADQLLKSSQAAIDEADELINKSLESVTDKTVPVKDIIADITDSINMGGGEVDEMGVKSILEGLAPQVKKTLSKETLTLAEANQLRSQLDKTLGNRAFMQAQLPYNKGILMDFTNAVREQVKGRAPQGVREAFNVLSKEMKLRDLISSKMAGAGKNQLIGLGDLISGGLGGVIGGGLPGIVAGAGLKRAAESTLTKTAGAVTIDKLDEVLSPVLANLEPAMQTTIINALAKAFSGSQGEPQQSATQE